MRRESRTSFASFDQLPVPPQAESLTAVVLELVGSINANMTWAAIAQRVAPPAQEKPLPSVAAPVGTTAVLDASAIISGFSRQVADNLTTVPEVLDECKDALAKQRLQLLPEGLKIQQPSADSVKRGAPAVLVLVCFVLSCLIAFCDCLNNSSHATQLLTSMYVGQ